MGVVRFGALDRGQRCRELRLQPGAFEWARVTRTESRQRRCVIVTLSGSGLVKENRTVFLTPLRVLRMVADAGLKQCAAK